MANAHFVKAARKDNPVAKKGESYWWWKFMQGGRGGPKHFSKERPRPSQLTQSEYLSSLYGIREDAEILPENAEDLGSRVEDIKSSLEDLKSDAESRYENIPDGLRESENGQNLQNRIDSVDNAIGDLDSVDVDFEADGKEESETEDEYKERWITDKWQEVTDILDAIEE